MTDILRVVAQVLHHPNGKELYSFTMDGKRVLQDIATISKVKRIEGSFIGHQRDEVKPHIKNIQKFIEHPKSYIPNPIVLAFDTRTRFVPQAIEGFPNNIGILEIALNSENPTGLVIDGQQRLTAIKHANVESYPLFVSAFITDSEDECREQFLNVNSAKPISNDLIFEMSAYSTTRPHHVISQIIEKLNYLESSPLHKRIKQPTNPAGDVAQNSIKTLIENSIHTKGLIATLLQEVNGEMEDFLDITTESLILYLSAVKVVWNDIWDSPPKDSKLLAGVGVNALGYMMDSIFRVYTDIKPESAPIVPPKAFFIQELQKIQPYCHWTQGTWQFVDTQRRWNELQNLGSDKNLLINYLHQCYTDT